MAKNEPGYILTARHEGKWRWASLGVVGTDRTAIVHAKKVIDAKTAGDFDPDDPDFDHEGYDIWMRGGITLANPSGRIIWTSPVQERRVS